MPGIIITFLVAALLCGLLVFLIDRAPFIDAEWKGYIRYGVLVLFVVWLVIILFGAIGTPLPFQRR